MSIDPPEPFSTISEQIAGDLRAMILKGEIKSRQPLRQDDLAAQFGVSKIPVREALVQLKAEGLVDFYPNRGAVVSDLTAAEADEIYLMRIALETTILARAIPNLTVATLIEAEGILDAMDRETDEAAWSEMNWSFHAALYTPAGLPRLLETIHTLHANVARYLILYLSKLDFQTESQNQHRAILEACRYGQVEKAAAHLEIHLRSAAQQLVAFLNSEPFV